MPRYRHQHGDRPLDGFTIEHGIGRGGFGEVYYAISDSGKHVALKEVQNFEEIELRGIRHCMNLKSPHLVTIFDVKYNDANEAYVIMEYVAGPSLRQLLDEMPQGMGNAKATFFLREIAKGLTYLHDCGIVHRDLKPHNIFYEEGYVKIGDYSLSKAISNTHHTAHTMTVGTVHYMAPEISKGDYGRSVDIYALGAMLYEMLTGQPPFTGGSQGEVLMKHLTAEPDLTGIDEPYARVIKKAMAKDPADRYTTAQELVEDLLGSENVQNSMVGFNDSDLTMIADRAAKKYKEHTPPIRPSDANHENKGTGTHNTKNQPNAKVEQGSGLPYHLGRSISGMAEAVGMNSHTPIALVIENAEQYDPLPKAQRKRQAFGTLMAITLGTTLFSSSFSTQTFELWCFILAMTASGTWGVILGKRWFVSQTTSNTSWHARMMIAGVAAAFVFILGSIVAGMGNFDFSDIMLATIIPLFLLDWPRITSPARPHRMKLSHAAAAAVMGFIACVFFTEHSPVVTMGVLVGVVMTTQVLYPFIPEAIIRNRRGHLSQYQSAKPHAVPASTHLEQTTKNPATEQVPPEHVLLGRTNPPPLPGNEAANISDKKCLPALLMSLVPIVIWPLCGLQRFYVGKIGTGLLWLFTFGLFGIGQLVDIILIALKQFRDVDGRLLLAWTNSSEIQPMSRSGRKVRIDPRPQSDSIRPLWQPSAGSLLMNLVGGLCLLVSLIVGFGLALTFHEALAADVLPGLDAELDSAFGYDEWPGLLEKTSYIVVWITALIATILLTVARRGGGAVHMIRVIIAVTGFGISLSILGEFQRFMRYNNNAWPEIASHIKAEKIGPLIESLLNGVFVGEMIFAIIFFLVSVVILALPSRRRLVMSQPMQRQEA